MSRSPALFGHALYQLAKESARESTIGRDLDALQAAFSEEPKFLRLLASPNLSRREKLQILDHCFAGHTDPYVLHFLKLLTEKGYIGQFSRCRNVYRELWEADMGLLQVRAVTPVPLAPSQSDRLREKLEAITGRRVSLCNSIEPGLLGGIRLEYGGKQIDGTLFGRLQRIGKVLQHDAF